MSKVANLKPALTPDKYKKLGVSNLKTAYEELAANYNRILDRDVLQCPSCGDFLKADTSFYYDNKYIADRFPICKKCIMKMVEQRKTDKDEPRETKESVQKVLRMLDRVYDNDFYESCVKGANTGVAERNRTSPFSTYITSISSLPNWKNKTYDDSDFGEDGVSVDDYEVKLVNKTIQSAKRRFGSGFSSEDYMFLENNYQDWCSRTQVDSLSQETYVKQICLQLLDIDKDRKAGKDVTNKLKALDQLMNSANLQPKQNVANAATDSLTFSQLIAKWEMEKPIPEPDPELCDVSGIGKKIRVWFGGWLASALGLNVPFTDEYRKEVEQYTVHKPELESSDNNSSTVYNDIFGASD